MSRTRAQIVAAKVRRSPASAPAFAGEAAAYRDAVHRRNAGKEEIARREVWRLEIGPHRFRCLVDGDGFLVQAREGGVYGQWKEEVARGPDPIRLLKLLVLAGSGLVSERASKVPQ